MLTIDVERSLGFRSRERKSRSPQRGNSETYIVPSNQKNRRRLRHKPKVHNYYDNRSSPESEQRGP